MGDLIHVDVAWGGANRHSRWGHTGAALQIGAVTGGAVDHRDGARSSGVGVGDIDGVVRFVGEDPHGEGADRDCRRCLVTAGLHMRVAGRSVDHRYRVVANVRYVNRVGCLVDRKGARIEPDLDRRPGSLAMRDVERLTAAPVDDRDRVNVGGCRTVVVAPARDVDRVGCRVDRYSRRPRLHWSGAHEGGAERAERHRVRSMTRQAGSVRAAFEARVIAT